MKVDLVIHMSSLHIPCHHRSVCFSTNRMIIQTFNHKAGDHLEAMHQKNVTCGLVF